MHDEESDTFISQTWPEKFSSMLKEIGVVSESKEIFNDAEQIRLRDFCTKLESIGYKWMLSNSDVKGKDVNDTFFDDIYSDFAISRVKASRRINANAEKRGELNELLITNY